MRLGSILTLLVSAAVLSGPFSAASSWAHDTVSGVVSKDAQKCRKTFNKAVGKYLNAGLKELAGCYKKGLAGKLPAGVATADCASVAGGDIKGKIAKTAAKATADVWRKCAAGITLADIGGLDACPYPCSSMGATADLAGLASCQLCLAEASIERLVVAQYGQVGEGLGKEEQKCVASVAKAGGKHTKTVLKTLAKCHEAVDKGKSVADCTNPAENDPKEKITRSRAKLASAIAAKCNDALLSALDVCNGYGSFVATATACISGLHVQVSMRDAHTVASKCGIDRTCDLDDESSSTCPLDCSPGVSPSVQAVFDNSCAVPACHSSSGAAAGLSLGHDDSAAQLIGVVSTQTPALERVAVGDPASSWLYLKVSQPAPAVGGRMPLGGDPLSTAEQEAIASWIADGLWCGDGSCDFSTGGETFESCPHDCRPTVPDAVQAIFDSSCAVSGCHDSFTASQNLDLSAPVAGGSLIGVSSGETLAALVEAGDSAASWLYTKVAQANPGVGAQMPLGLPLLSAAEQETIRLWIDSGAPPE